MHDAVFQTKLNERFDVHSGYIQEASQTLCSTLEMYPPIENHVTMYHKELPYSGRAVWLLLALCYDGVAPPPHRKAIKTRLQEASHPRFHGGHRPLSVAGEVRNTLAKF